MGAANPQQRCEYAMLELKARARFRELIKERQALSESHHYLEQALQTSRWEEISRPLNSSFEKEVLKEEILLNGFSGRGFFSNETLLNSFSRRGFLNHEISLNNIHTKGYFSDEMVLYKLELFNDTMLDLCLNGMGFSCSFILASTFILLGAELR